jgi:hypothetical protein
VSEIRSEWFDVENSQMVFPTGPKRIGDMTREELYKTIRHLFAERSQQRTDSRLMMEALRDTKRGKGGAFQRWLFGS